MSLKKIGKTLNVLTMLTVFSLGLSAPVLSKDTIQQSNQGPGNMDAPNKKVDMVKAATPAPTPAPKKEPKPKKEKSGSAGTPSSGGY